MHKEFTERAWQKRRLTTDADAQGEGEDEQKLG